MTEHTEATLTDAVRKTWPFTQPRPRYITAVQVRSSAGYGASRMLDVIVIDTWPGAGLSIHGIEIKTTRADLRRELQNTKKFEDFAQHLDLFSIVAPKGVATLDMLPAKWGLYCPTDTGKLRARRKPLMLHDGGNLKTINRSMAVAFMRALVYRSLATDAMKEAVAEGKAERDRFHANNLSRLKQSVAGAQETIERFEEESGVKLRSYNSGRIGEAVQFVLGGGLNTKIGYANDLRELGNRLVSIADELDTLKALYDQKD